MISLYWSCQPDESKPLRIAVASSLSEPINKINAAFTEQNQTEHEIIIGSSGKLTAQISHGAPYDIFITADFKYIEELKNKGFIEGLPSEFILGSLVVWNSIYHEDLSLDMLASEKIKKIAIPNPAIAPYGKAAKEALINLELWDRLKSKMVFGESVTQTNQFLMTGAVEAGITSQSLMHFTEIDLRGSWMPIDSSFHDPIIHGIAVIKTSSDKKAIKKYIDFLKTSNSVSILQQYGYKTPI